MRFKIELNDEMIKFIYLKKIKMPNIISRFNINNNFLTPLFFDFSIKIAPKNVIKEIVGNIRNNFMLLNA